MCVGSPRLNSFVDPYSEYWILASPEWFRLHAHRGVDISTEFMSSDRFTKISSGFLWAGHNTTKCKTSVLVVFEIKKTEISSDFHWFCQVQGFSVSGQGQRSRIGRLKTHNLWEGDCKRSWGMDGNDTNVLLELR